MAGAHPDLMPGEKVVLAANPHWWFFWKEAAGIVGVVGLLVLTALASGGLATFLGWLTLLGFIAWVADTGYRFAQWRTTRFAVTDQRVTYQSGLLRRRGVSIPLNRVNNVNFEQSFTARLLGNGVVTIESAGETGDSVFENIPDPDRARRVIFQQMEAHASADAERDAAALARAMQSAGPAAPEVSSVEARLAQLEELRDKGVVSESEYEQKRSQILDSL